MALGQKPYHMVFLSLKSMKELQRDFLVEDMGRGNSGRLREKLPLIHRQTHFEDLGSGHSH